MPLTEQLWNRADVERLMNLNLALAELTHSVELTEQIPTYLSRYLQLDAISVAIFVQNDRDAQPSIAVAAASGAMSTLGRDELAATLQEIHRQTCSTSRDGHPERADAPRSFAQTAVQSLPGYPRQLVLTRVLSETHALVVVVHLTADQPLPSGTVIETLILAVDQVGKQLRALFAWQENPAVLGSPFERLTEREWVVLRGLNSDDGEKQLADRLELSPHTLHSHIKAIYRKLGVQGRLPLLLRLNAAVRQMRLSFVALTKATLDSRERAVG